MLKQFVNEWVEHANQLKKLDYEFGNTVSAKVAEIATREFCDMLVRQEYRNNNNDTTTGEVK